MERRTDIITAEKIMGQNFIGPEQLDSIKEDLGIISPFQMYLDIPQITFDLDVLEKHSTDYILILGIPIAFDDEPLTINKMRSFFGFDPSVKEPCFYNQDWYLKEDFANSKTLAFKWYLIRKLVYNETRGMDVLMVTKKFSRTQNLPSAILASYTFFANYLLNDYEILWCNDYIWCEDLDHNGDRIYVGRYIDISGSNKNGFNIHRHLKINNNYGFVNIIVKKAL